MHAIPRGQCRQMLPNLWLGGLRALAVAALCVYALGAVASPPPARAVDFSDGELRLSLDTTLSHGLTFRVEEQDDLLASYVNRNDGNLNYDRGLVSNTSKFTTDLDLGYRNFGAFLRLNGFLDFENEHGERQRTPLSDEAKELVGQDIILLDAYLTGAFEVGNVAIDLRLGSHVLNWGESTFIQNGINAINPFDVSKLRLPGSELREGLLPVPMVSASVALTYALSVEGFYQLDWEKTKIDPVGSYFSVTDYVGAGAEKAVISLPGVNITDTGLGPGSMLGFEPLIPVINADLDNFRAITQAGLEQQRGLLPGSLAGAVTIPYDQPATDPNFLTVERNPDHNPDDSGQWGVALRYFAEALNATEFGFYFVNYHSRLPLVSARTGSRAGIQSGLAAAQAVGRQDSATITAVTQAVTPAVVEAVTQAVTPVVTQRITEAVQAGEIDPAAAPALIAAQVREQAAAQVPGRVAEQVAAQIGGIAGLLAIDRYAKTGSYFIEYPEDLQLFGLSFNTELGATGWALQGEYSFRRDAPLQKAERALFAGSLAPITRLLDTTHPAYIPPADVPAYLNNYTPMKVQGYIERDVSQVQATATKVFGPVLGSDSGAFVTEAAVMHVHGMPENDVMPLESPAGEPDNDPATNSSDAEATSWGYRLAARLDYNNAVGATNLFPYLQFQHDVGGNSPSPSGSFVEGRTALTLGVRAGYLSRWEADLNFTMYGGRENELHDRDFVSVTVKYSF